MKEDLVRPGSLVRSKPSRLSLHLANRSWTQKDEAREKHTPRMEAASTSPACLYFIRALKRRASLVVLWMTKKSDPQTHHCTTISVSEVTLRTEQSSPLGNPKGRDERLARKPPLPLHCSAAHQHLSNNNNWATILVALENNDHC